MARLNPISPGHVVPGAPSGSKPRACVYFGAEDGVLLPEGAHPGDKNSPKSTGETLLQQARGTQGRASAVLALAAHAQV